MATNKDPRQLIDLEEMTTIQYVVVALTVLLNAMDGFDVLSIAFASPGIAAEWGIPSSGLGVVLSMELIGMAFGSVLLGGVADKIGRRPTLIGCLIVMAMGMVGVAAAAVNPVVLSIWRVFTGLGIGGMLSATNAVVSEFSNNRRRKFCISMMVIGYPLGAGIGGLYASNLIGPYGWRAVFYFGAAITSLLLPAIILFVPESVHWLARKQPANALERINASLKKIGHETIAALPALPTNEAKKSIGDIFSPALRMTTILVTLGYFLHIMTFYFLLKWTPRIITAMSFPAPEAGTVLAYANLGGAAGGFLFGVLTRYVGLKPLTIVILVMNAVAVAIFGRSPVELGTLTMLAVIVGFFGNAAVSGLYSIVAYGFPSHVRATGTGFVIGVGRGGAALSPTIAGILLGNEVLQNLPSVAIIMGMGSLIAAVVLAFLNMQGMDEPVGAVEKRPNLGAAGAQARA